MKNVKPANFKVDTSLTSILGENYRSTESALKELVDNSWDADAVGVNISMPEPLESAEVSVSDNGSGMTEQEIRNEYLFIARSRTSRKGEFTPNKKRRVKGRKGIGKFAGLLIAGEMQLISKARGRETTLTINKNDILKWKDDLEKLDLQISSRECPEDQTGTTIILKNLNQNLHFPNPLRLSQLLITEYGRENGFEIVINDLPLDIQDLTGYSESGSITTDLIGTMNYSFTISDEKRNLKQSGIAIRVDGKIIGRPSYFGLEDDVDIPKSLLGKIYAEVEVDGLADDITADWGAIFENSKKLEEVKSLISPIIKDALMKIYDQHVVLAKARLEKKINRELQKLPEHKRGFVNRALNKVLKSYYNESEEKINTVISVVFDTLEKDEYNDVLSLIKKSKNGTEKFADALSQFGVVEASILETQAKSRNQFLDYFEKLMQNVSTSDVDVRKSMENNLWILKEQFSPVASNPVLQKICNDYLDGQTSEGEKQPELLLCQRLDNNILLIEFKGPKGVIGKREKTSARKYQKDLSILFPNSKVTVLVLGKSISAENNAIKKTDLLVFDTYESLLSNSRNRINWLIKGLN